ncbi:DUF3889 domain-containing protein [Peribacillus saganii]|uniref:DUF3889 domain-containing protein n=1 Tax=Peribacillus saganii TaxID=2303992 RepID=A0A372LUG6_9BACI|nr:DUF3889 domain-containing protein [Peribacillus saganii]RFU71440.1 DUF3889 domain-containing protein [Peribacillus saganii]
MKKLMSILCMVMFLGQGSAFAQQPDYEKYGKIAITVVQADYPEANVTDYQYLGRKDLGNGQVSDSFLFKVSQDGKERDVVVTVNHSLTNNRLLNLKVEEKSPSQSTPR